MADKVPITHDLTSEGFAFFRGPSKLAVATCFHDQGKRELLKSGDGNQVNDKEGHPVFKPVLELMPRESWTLHFTAPSMKIEDLEEMIAALPKDDPTKHTSERVAV